MFVCYASFILALKYYMGSKKYTRDFCVLCDFHFGRSNISRVVKSIPVMSVCFVIFTFSDPM